VSLFIVALPFQRGPAPARHPSSVRGQSELRCIFYHNVLKSYLFSRAGAHTKVVESAVNNECAFLKVGTT
jgi:hypothetical protein